MPVEQYPEPGRRIDLTAGQDIEVAQNHRILAQAASALLRNAPFEAATFRPYAGMMTGEPGGGHLVADLIACGELLNESAEYLTDADVEIIDRTGMLVDVVPMATDETTMSGGTERTRAHLIAFRGTDHLPRTRMPFIVGTVAVRNPRGKVRLFNTVVLENGTVCVPPEPIDL
jgi:hypothetical protein